MKGCEQRLPRPRPEGCIFRNSICSSLKWARCPQLRAGERGPQALRSVSGLGRCQRLARRLGVGGLRSLSGLGNSSPAGRCREGWPALPCGGGRPQMSLPSLAAWGKSRSQGQTWRRRAGTLIRSPQLAEALPHPLWARPRGSDRPQQGGQS